MAKKAKKKTQFKSGIRGIIPNTFKNASGEVKLSSWMYQPSSKGRPKGSPRPSPIWLDTKDLDEAIDQVRDIDLEQIQAVRNNSISTMLDRACAEKIRLGKWNRSTPSNGRGAMKRLVDDIGDIAFTKLTPAKLKDWFSSMQEEGLALSTANAKMRWIKALLSELVSMGVINKNPASQLGLPASTNTRREKFCTREQRDMLIAKSSREDLSYVLNTGFHTGMRIGEIVASRPEWFDINGDFKSGSVTLQNERQHVGGGKWVSKRGKSRTIPLTTEYLYFLKSYGLRYPYMLHPEKEPTGKSGNYRYDITGSFKTHAKKCGLPWVTPHTMRHTFGSLLVIDGKPELKIRRWMGITAKTFETHYAGLDPQDDDINLSQ